MCLHKPEEPMGSKRWFGPCLQPLCSNLPPPPYVAPASSVYSFNIILIGMEREVQQLVEMVRVWCSSPAAMPLSPVRTP